MNGRSSTIAAVCLAVLPMICQAGAPAHCQNQAHELAEQAGQSIFPGMSVQQRADLQQLASEVCARHSADTTSARGSEFGGDAASARDSESDGHWFSEWILKGEPADKPGNRRLERRQRQ